MDGDMTGMEPRGDWAPMFLPPKPVLFWVEPPAMMGPLPQG